MLWYNRSYNKKGSLLMQKQTSCEKKKLYANEDYTLFSSSVGKKIISEGYFRTEPVY
jgi:hypothetical protein